MEKQIPIKYQQDTYEALVNTFIKTLMENQGYYCRVPLWLYKNMDLKEVEDQKKKIWSHVTETLDLMGVIYKTNIQSLSIMIVPIDADWTQGIQ